MKKPRLSTILFFLLLIAGLGVMFYPKMCDLYQRYLISQEMNEYNQKIADQLSDHDSYAEEWAKAEEYNAWLLTKDTQLAADKEEQERVSHLLNPLGNGMMGTIEIPSIDVNLPVYQGTDETELQSGAGWWIGSSLPTGGPSTHCVITAHTGLVKAALFTDLDKMKEGDTFSLHVLNRDLFYEVDQVLVVEPIETDPLRIVEGKDYVTLYTCTPYGVNTHRLLVRGHRIDPPEIPVTEVIAAKAKSYWWLLVLAGVPLLVLLFWLFKHRKKKPVVKEEPVKVYTPGMVRQVPISRRYSDRKWHKTSTTRSSTASDEATTKLLPPGKHRRRSANPHSRGPIRRS